jgi:putative flippase GtrA
LDGVALPHRLDAAGPPQAPRHRLARFLAIGAVSTAAYLGVFWALRAPLGGQGANAAALLLTAVANTAANRRFTFGVRGRTARTRHQIQGLGVFAVGLALTSGSLALLHRQDANPGRTGELAVLVAANLAATAARFALLRRWVFRAQAQGAAR